MKAQYTTIKAAVLESLGIADKAMECRISLQEALTAECGKAGTAKADEAFKKVRDTLTKGMTKRNETLKAAAGKKTSELDENGKLCRMHLLLSVTWANLKPNGRKNKKGARAGKVAVTKVTGVAKAQVRILATKPKKLADTLRVILATIQATEKPEYRDVPKLVAALQVAIDLAQ
jgi:hypothetical protein